MRPGKIVKLHPAGRLVGWAWDAYDVWQFYNNHVKNPAPGGWNIPPGTNFSCGSPGGNHMATRGAVSSNTSPTICALTFQAVATNSNPGLNQGRSYHFQNKYKVGLSERADYVGLFSYPPPYTGPGPTFVVGTEPFIPLVPKPRPGVTPGGDRRPLPKPGPRPAPGGKPAPPKPREKERKGKIAAGLGRAVEVAFAASEGADAVDAIWEALPKEYRQRTAKSGVARKGALIGEGTRYSTTIDKAIAIYKYYKHLNLSEAAKNLLINHFVDKVIGTMSAKGADKLRKRLGASGWGNVI